VEPAQDGVELLAKAFEPADDVIVDDVGDEQVDLQAPVVVEDARIVEQALDGISERDRAGSVTVIDGIAAGLADRRPELPVLGSSQASLDFHAETSRPYGLRTKLKRR
jgi:hypothetical protein